MMPQQEPVVLQEFDGGWLQMQDAQGVFYYNTITKQESAQIPAQLRPSSAKASAPPTSQQGFAVQYAQPQAAPQSAGQEQSQVKLQLGDWMVCEDAQGEFYYHAPSSRSFDTPPPEFMEAYRAHQSKSQQSAPAQAYSSNAYSQAAVVNKSPAMAAPPAAPTQEQTAVKAQFGNWMICTDSQGDFYFNQTTQQSFDSPPPEFLQAYQAHQLAQQHKQQPQLQSQQPKMQQPQQKQQQLQQQLLLQQQQAQQQQLQQQQVQSQPQAPKARLGNWAIHEDAQGEFYVHEPTGQMHEVMPQELMQLLQLELQKQELKKQTMHKMQQPQQQITPKVKLQSYQQPQAGAPSYGYSIGQSPYMQSSSQYM